MTHIPSNILATTIERSKVQDCANRLGIATDELSDILHLLVEDDNIHELIDIITFLKIRYSVDLAERKSIRDAKNQQIRDLTSKFIQQINDIKINYGIH